jgi:hypothetical protein
VPLSAHGASLVRGVSPLVLHLQLPALSFNAFACGFCPSQ